MKKNYQCTQCKKWFHTQGGITKHGLALPPTKKGKRVSKCNPDIPDSYKHD